jgi:hypothetical protein
MPRLLEVSVRAAALAALLTAPALHAATPPGYTMREIGPGLMPLPFTYDLTTATPHLLDDGTVAIARGGQLVLWKDGAETSYSGPGTAGVFKAFDTTRGGSILVLLSGLESPAPAAIWSRGAFTNVGDPALWAIPYGLNSRGQVVAFGASQVGGTGGSVFLSPGASQPVTDAPSACCVLAIDTAGRTAGLIQQTHLP